MTFKKFEEIQSWQMARELCKFIKQLTKNEAFSKDWALRNQITASSGSIMDCIAEGHERSSNKEFVYFLGIAKGSCGETRSQAYRAFDFSYISHVQCSEIVSSTNRIGAAIQALINHLNQSEIKGIRNESYIKTNHMSLKKHPFEPPYFPQHPPPGV